ncbi:HAD-like protein [Cristinia sonorae]|uniref:HAD-like protein n=1 Tax=Cristinia sonorae TaxID=1940300 RepID=A0A8K0XKT9_9AGAR|nr:HAD-like protein [Cristinia sonorae]
MASEFNPLKYKALIFDVYSTLIDWENGVYEGVKPLLDRVNPALAKSKRDALFAYFSVEDDLQARYPTMLYADILARAHAELATRSSNKPSPPETIAASTATATSEVSAHTKGGTVPSTTGAVGTSQSVEDDSVDPSQAEHVAFGKSIPTWKPFPDTIPALAYLSTKFKLIVLSNVDRESFKGTQSVLETSDPENPFHFDAVYTAQDIGSYKPNPANFEYALNKLKEEFGVEKSEVLVVAASLTHDHVPANTLGITSVFIDRNAVSLNLDPEVARYDAKFPTLGAFAKEVEKRASHKA